MDYLEQEPKLDPDKTVIEVVREGAGEAAALLAEFEEISAKFGEPLDDDETDKILTRQGEVQERLDALGAWDLDSRLELAMDALRCPPGDTSIKVLSGGELRRVALCRLLLEKPDILLLDEPTNHLDAESVACLEQYLQRYEGASSVRPQVTENCGNPVSGEFRLEPLTNTENLLQLRNVFEVDPLPCQCGAEMKIIAVVTDPARYSFRRSNS